MRTYVVQPGDSPGSIAARFAGCPKCAGADLPGANPHKPTVTYPNGFRTFRTLDVGETISLPDKWFDGSLDSRPPAYFQALPYADGVTPSPLGVGAAGVLGDFAVLDQATQKLAALAAMDDPTFSSNVGSVGSTIDAAVHEAYGSQNAQAAGLAQTVQDGTQWAWTRNGDLATALANSDIATVTQARLDIQGALTTALNNARLALGALYAQPTPGGGFSPTLVSAAQALANAVAADPNYCASVAQAGSAVNAAVHDFKAAWNGSQVPPVPVDTGNYEAATANAVMQVFGSAPVPCSGGAPQPQPRPPAPSPPKPYVAPPQPPPVAVVKQGLSTGAVLGIGLAAAATVGGIAYAATRRPRARRARERECCS